MHKNTIPDYQNWIGPTIQTEQTQHLCGLDLVCSATDARSWLFSLPIMKKLNKWIVCTKASSINWSKTDAKRTLLRYICFHFQRHKLQPERQIRCIYMLQLRQIRFEKKTPTKNWFNCIIRTQQQNGTWKFEFIWLSIQHIKKKWISINLTTPHFEVNYNPTASTESK